MHLIFGGCFYTIAVVEQWWWFLKKYILVLATSLLLIPNMLGQISTAMAAAGLNIHNMLNKSKREMAYTLVDVDSPVSAGVIQELSAIKGVLSVRYLPA